MKRKTLQSLDPSTVLSACASLVAACAIGLLVHDIMWSHVAADEAERAPVKHPARPVRISSGTLVA